LDEQEIAVAVDALTRTPAPAAQQSERSVLLVAAGAAFLALLDTTVASLAVADVRSDFGGASVGGATWVITIYAVTFAAFLAPAGRVADVLGRRTLMLAGVGTFTAMSLLAALAPSLPVLLAARALQGIGAAAMIPASLAVVLADTPPERRAAAIGAWSAAGALAAAAGPALGGVLVDALGWRSLFLVNVPFGLAIVAGTLLIPRTHATPGRLPDPAGIVLLGTGVGALALGTAQGPEWGWASADTLIVLGSGVLAVVAALVRSTRHVAPAIETRLWRTRSFALANLASLFYGAALFPWLLVGVLFLIGVWDYSPLEAGLAMTPGAVVASVVALRAGPVVRRHGARAVIASGALVLASAGLLCALALPATPSFLTFWLPVGALIGVGTGAITTGVSTAAALSVAPPRFAAAVGLNQTGRQVGGALGVAALAALLNGRIGAGAGVAPYADVYLFCTIATFAVAIAALWLVLEEKS
jgi:EmrB/QacA subfamily drug resistance transporter